MCQKNYITKKKYSHLNYTEKTMIERWYNIEKKKCSEIAALLNKSTRTIQREIKRGLTTNLTKNWEEIKVYSADISNLQYEMNKTAKGPKTKLGNNHEMAKFIEDEIKIQKHSPEIIAFEIKMDDRFKTKISARTIRNCITREELNIKQKDMIYKKIFKDKNKKKIVFAKIPADKSIEYRPKEANARSEYGHWEGDLIVGKDGRGAALFTMTERLTREEIIMKMPSKHAKNVKRCLDVLEKKYGREFRKKFKTITFDNGGEFRDYKLLEKSYNKKTKSPRVKIFYAHPYCSGERGTNENGNRLVRRFLPKGTILTNVSDEKIKEIENWINNLLRPMFGFKSSIEMVRENYSEKVCA